MYRPPRCDDLYVATEMMDMDLEGLLGSGAFGWLTKDHGRFLGYQVLRGLKALHDVGIMHRDVKPANILVDRRCHVKLCDFGLCAPITSYPNTDPTSTYIATRWYRAPEIVFPGGLYNEKVDIWAAGCVITEILTRRSPFPGESSMDQRTRLIKPSICRISIPPHGPRSLKTFTIVSISIQV
ncbi:kinase-like domain-containing protein [Chytridium lagenaria]|nr:kinase-like domain-containing protein [Chytridium lagenaria]